MPRNDHRDDAARNQRNDRKIDDRQTLDEELVRETGKKNGRTVPTPDEETKNYRVCWVQPDTVPKPYLCQIGKVQLQRVVLVEIDDDGFFRNDN